MIYDRLPNLRKYFDEGDRFCRAIKYALAFDLAKPDGDYEVEGKHIFAKVRSYNTSPARERTFEEHKLYADIQIMHEGSERQDVVLAERLEPLGGYQEQKDVTKYNPPTAFSSILLHPGEFVVYYPGDIHRPNCSAKTGSQKVRKICMKVKL